MSEKDLLVTIGEQEQTIRQLKSDRESWTEKCELLAEALMDTKALLRKAEEEKKTLKGLLDSARAAKYRADWFTTGRECHFIDDEGRIRRALIGTISENRVWVQVEPDYPSQPWIRIGLPAECVHETYAEAQEVLDFRERFKHPKVI